MPVKSDKTNNNKKSFLEALKNAHGVVTAACNTTGLSRTTFYDWCNNDAEFKSQVDDVQEIAVDFVESKLFEKINGVECAAVDSKGGVTVYDQPPSDTAIIFFLKTRGKKRGYIERTEIDTMGTTVQPAPVVNIFNTAPPLSSSEKEVDA